MQYIQYMDRWIETGREREDECGNWRGGGWKADLQLHKQRDFISSPSNSCCVMGFCLVA